MKHSLICAILLIALPLPALAQKGGQAGQAGTVDRLLACRAQSASADRLACFDRLANELAGEIERKEVRVVDSATVVADQKAQFGLAAGAAAATTAGVASAEKRVDSISSTVVSASSYSFGKYQITLADGSVWRTTEQSATMDPRPGDAVAIQRAAIGSYRAKVGKSELVRVARVR